MARKKLRGAAKPKPKAKGATKLATGKGTVAPKPVKTKPKQIRATKQEASEVEAEIREALEGTARAIEERTHLIVYRNRNGSIDADLGIKVPLQKATEEEQSRLTVLEISQNLYLPRPEEVWFTVRLHFLRYNWDKKRTEHIVKYSDPVVLSDGRSVMDDRYGVDTIQMNWRLGIHAPSIMFALLDPSSGVLERVVTKYTKKKRSKVSVHLTEVHLKMHWNKAIKRPFKGR